MHCWSLTCLFASIGSALIDPETYPWVCNKIVYGPYPNRKYIFASSAGFWKVVARVTVGCSELFALVDVFFLSKISFELLVQSLFFYVDFCVFNLLSQRPLIMKLVLACVSKFSVGRIQTGHTDLFHLQVCGMLW